MDEKIRVLGDWTIASDKMVIFTGAGASTESGIPDFRSPGGIWDKFDPNEFHFAKFLQSEETREKVWAFYRSTWPSMLNAKPNRVHMATFELHKMGKLDCVITQNVDGLHQQAGVPDEMVIELHGTVRQIACLSCGERPQREEVEKRLESGEKAPRCEDCGGLLKPATISFGQSLPADALEDAMRRSAASDLFVAVGSSLVVYPAAEMPQIAKTGGARLAIINYTPTPYDHAADIVIQGGAGDIMDNLITYVSKSG